PTPGAPAADTQIVHQILYLSDHPPHALHTPPASSPHWSFPVLAIPLVDNRLSSSSHFKAGQPGQLRPLSGRTRGSQKRSSGEKKEKGRRKKQEQSAKKRIMNQKIQQPCLKSEQPTTSGQFAGLTCLSSHRSDRLSHPSSCRLLQTYMQLSLYPRPNACRKSTAARVRAAVLIRDQLRDRGKGPSLTARQLKRLWICSYEALRTQVTLLRKSPSTCFWSDVRSPPAMPLSWLARRQESCKDEPTPWF
ncbi:hypothetical protein CFAM422_010762, partial [Trichoderma lentiforme]